jgi:hypothetical protein
MRGSSCSPALFSSIFVTPFSSPTSESLFASLFAQMNKSDGGTILPTHGFKFMDWNENVNELKVDSTLALQRVDKNHRVYAEHVDQKTRQVSGAVLVAETTFVGYTTVWGCVLSKPAPFPDYHGLIEMNRQFWNCEQYCEQYALGLKKLAGDAWFKLHTCL